MDNEYHKNYRQKNRDKIKEYNKLWYENNKDKKKKYKQDNKELISEYFKQRKEQTKNYYKNYYLENKNKIILNGKKYRLENNLSTGNIRSLPEKKIEKLFEKNNIKYINEKWFNGCRNNKGNLLYFDFYLVDYNILIEYDGIFHYKAIYGEKKFLETKLHDSIKDDFCKTNNLKLIRIKHDEIDKENFEESLINYLTL